MGKLPVVSILSAFKDDKSMLKIVMDSILQQDYPQIEHVVVDAASKDGSVELLKEYSEKYRKKGFSLVWKSEPDKGIYDGYNKAGKMMSGEYFMFCVADPFVDTHSVSTLVNHLLKGKIDWVCGGAIYSKNGVITRRWSGKSGNWRLGWMAATGTICLKRSVVNTQGCLLEEKYTISADYDFQLRLMTDTSLRFESISMPIIHYIAGGASNGTIKGNLKAIKEDYSILRNRKIKFAWVTLGGMCIRALCAYVFASRKKVPTDLFLQSCQR